MLVILDRDGVINQYSPDYIRTVAEWKPIAGSLQAIARLKHSGASVVVCTNQSGIGRGILSTDALQKIHRHMENQLAMLDVSLDAIYYCPHHPADGCECRKPQPGMLRQARREYAEPGEICYFIGDSPSDLEAACQARCGAVLVRTGRGLETERQRPVIARPVVFDTLPDAAEWLIKLNNNSLKQ